MGTDRQEEKHSPRAAAERRSSKGKPAFGGRTNPAGGESAECAYGSSVGRMSFARI
jgi:hypothetical protein